jgi:adenylylsulfate reductase subunit B
MPTFVRTDKCDGCKSRDKPACVYICPHDLMMLDVDGSRTGHAMQAFNQEPEQCWECYACVKICPQNAIEVRHYADVVPLGASVQPLRGSDSIIWTIKFRNGTIKRFKFPTRTTPEGSADPYSGKPRADMAEIEDHSTLFTHATHSCDLSQFIGS